jgi:hypothetical protein
MSKRRTTLVWAPWWVWGFAGVFTFMWQAIALPFRMLRWVLTPDPAAKATARRVAANSLAVMMAERSGST